MGIARKLTITRKIPNRTFPQYPRFSLYLAREITPSAPGPQVEVYLLSKALYNNNQEIWLDPDYETEPMVNNPAGILDDRRIYVQTPPATHIRKYTIISPHAGKDIDDYKGYKLYLAKDHDKNTNIYILTREDLAKNTLILIDRKKEIVPMEGNPSGYLDGRRIIVYRPAHIALSDHFRIRAILPADAPHEYFKGTVITRQKYSLYRAERVAAEGYKGELGLIFAEAFFYKSELVPVAEMTRLENTSQPANDKYYLYKRDEDAFRKRAWAATRAVGC